MVKKLTRREHRVRLAAFVLTAFVLAHFPWRLAVLGAEVLAMNPGPIRIVPENDRFWDTVNLEVKLSNLGWDVSYEPKLEFEGQRAFGLTQRRKHTITIDSGLSWNDRLAVLAHEGGHVLEPGWADENQGEVFAESVAMLVSRDGYREHARYLARFKVDLVMMYLLEWRAMYHAAAVLGDR